jgi:hypothetical protein
MLSNLALLTQSHRPVLIAAGLAWLTRAAIGLYRPDYWSPRTALDYAAVVGTSLALILTAIGVWGFYRQNPAPPGRAQIIWQVGIAVTCVSAFTVGVSNFIEDALNVSGLGYVWVVGILALTAGLLSAGLSALWINNFSRWVGVMFLICAIGLLFTETNGQFGLGLALLVLSLVPGMRS